LFKGPKPYTPNPKLAWEMGSGSNPCLTPRSDRFGQIANPQRCTLLLSSFNTLDCKKVLSRVRLPSSYLCRNDVGLRNNTELAVDYSEPPSLSPRLDKIDDVVGANPAE